MTIPNPDHLLQQAERLISAQPRDVDIRRAISAAYYSLFHAASIEVADHLVGVRHRRSETYSLVYRSVEHGALRNLCEQLQRPRLTDKYHHYEPEAGFAPGIKGFATAILELQRKRHSADYDPLARLTKTEARLAISGGRTALARFKHTSKDQRRIFGTLLLFPPR